VPACLASVLIVEDDADTRLGLELRLTASDYLVTSAGDVEEAIVLARSIRPDVMILDLGLPGMGGLEFLARMGELLPDWRPRIIVLSAWDEWTYEAPALDLGAALYLEKPVVYEDLLRGVRFLLNP
jgi:DNA-binding response OmpR family regulator